MPRGSNSIDLGSSTNLVLRPPTLVSGVSNGRVGSSIESRSQEPLGGRNHKLRSRILWSWRNPLGCRAFEAQLRLGERYDSPVSVCGRHGRLPMFAIMLTLELSGTCPIDRGTLCPKSSLNPD